MYRALCFFKKLKKEPVLPVFFIFVPILRKMAHEYHKPNRELELVSAAKETFKRLYDIHSGKESPVTRQAITQ